MGKIKSFDFQMVIKDGRLVRTADAIKKFNAIEKILSDGDKVNAKVLSDDELDYDKWFGWFFGILIPISQYYLELPEPCLRDKNICLTYFKKEYCRIVDHSLMVKIKDYAGEVGYVLFSISRTGGLTKGQRIDFTNFIKGIIETQTGISYQVIEDKYRVENNIEPTKFEYKY